MAANIHYEYLAGTPDAVQECWERLGQTEQGLAPPQGQVHFIPANGGCFVVIGEPRPRSLSFSWRRKSWWKKNWFKSMPRGEAARLELDRLKRAFEDSRGVEPLPS